METSQWLGFTGFQAEKVIPIFTSSHIEEEDYAPLLKICHSYGGMFEKVAK